MMRIITWINSGLCGEYTSVAVGYSTSTSA